MPDDKTEKQLQEFVEKQEGTDEKPVGSKITKTPEPKFAHTKTDEQMNMGNKVGWQKLPIDDLPTKGLFYPVGTEIAIRSATAAEIRHWSTIQEADPFALDDMLNHIIERCVSFKAPDVHSSWKDIKEVDRFYILL